MEMIAHHVVADHGDPAEPGVFVHELFELIALRLLQQEATIHDPARAMIKSTSRTTGGFHASLAHASANTTPRPTGKPSLLSYAGCDYHTLQRTCPSIRMVQPFGLGRSFNWSVTLSTTDLSLYSPNNGPVP